MRRTGLCHLDVHRSAVPDAIHSAGGVSPKYLSLEARVLDDLVEVWRVLDSVHTDEEGEEEDEGDLRGWLKELLLSSTEQDNLRELAREAPTCVQLQRVLRCHPLAATHPSNHVPYFLCAILMGCIVCRC